MHEQRAYTSRALSLFPRSWISEHPISHAASLSGHSTALSGWTWRTAPWTRRLRTAGCGYGQPARCKIGSVRAEAPNLHHWQSMARRCSNGPTPLTALACVEFVRIGVVVIVAVLGAKRLERFIREVAAGRAVIPELGRRSLLRSVGTSCVRRGMGWEFCLGAGIGLKGRGGPRQRSEWASSCPCH